jgi:hypothetical protein
VVDPGPPVYAWDWLARQRVVWQEIRRRLIAGTESSPPHHRGGRRTADVPDWSLDHPDLVTTPPGDAEDPEPRESLTVDYRSLGTRAEVVAALREDYPTDAHVRSIVDGVVGEVAFLGRLGIPLSQLGVRSAPRGMRWWWSHLTGEHGDATRSDATDVSEHSPPVPLQLRLVDVLAGYGDVTAD